MMKNIVILFALLSGMLITGCSSVMSHTGGKEGIYPGTRASSTMLANNNTGIGMKSLVVLDMPFTTIMDTLLLPWDLFRQDSSLKSRVEKSEQNNLVTNSIIPPSPMPVR